MFRQIEEGLREGFRETGVRNNSDHVDLDSSLLRMPSTFNVLRWSSLGFQRRQIGWLEAGPR